MGFEFDSIPISSLYCSKQGDGNVLGHRHCVAGVVAFIGLHYLHVCIVNSVYHI